MPRIEWIGIKLPSDNEVIQFNKITNQLSRSQREAIQAIDLACVSLVRIGGGTGWEMGPTQDSRGLSKHYRWTAQTNFIQDMVPSDWAIVRRGPEGPQFRNLDDPRDAKRDPEYPSQEFLSKVSMNKFGKLAVVGSVRASVAHRLLRAAKREKRRPTMIGQRLERRDKKPA